MAIEILDTTITYDDETAISQTAIFVIDGFLYSRGGLSPTATKNEIQTALEAEETLLAAKAAAKGIVFDVLENKIRERRVLKAFVFVVLDEINRLTEKVNELNNGLDVIGGRVNQILDAADNATSLADFKSSMAAINDLPVGAIEDLPLRDESQIRGAIKNKLTE